MPTIRLTQLAADKQSPPATGRVIYWDRLLPGFGLRLTAKGARSWVAMYRVGVFITIPGVNRVEMSHVVTRGGSGSFLGMFNMFSGGALQQLSIFTLGIMPYVTSSIVMQLLTVVVPKLDQLNKEGEQGWELVQVIEYSPEKSPSYIAFLKRAKQ